MREYLFSNGHTKVEYRETDSGDLFFKFGHTAYVKSQYPDIGSLRIYAKRYGGEVTEVTNA